MKAVFLDLDGVLNIGGTRKFGELETCLIDKVNKITNHEDVQTILTSSWCLFHGFEKTVECLIQHGFKGNITTYLFDDIPRIARINNWVKKHKPESHVILDDYIMFDSRQIYVNPNYGLSDNDVTAALIHLHVAAGLIV